jgi:beta-glucosidase
VLTYIRQGVFVGYRSYEVRNLEPLFPFGHGLSYTTFEYSDLSATSISDNDKAEFTVSITITNTGSVPGREVALVFVSDAECSLPRPVRELKGFAKTKMLGPGEKQRVEVKLGREALAFWDSRRRTSTGGNGSWVAEKGEFGITVAGLETKVVLEKELAWRGL